MDSGSIGVAVSGSVVAVSHARGTDFTTATHAIWWVMTASGAAVLVLGFGRTRRGREEAKNGSRTCSKSRTDLVSANLCTIAEYQVDRPLECIGCYGGSHVSWIIPTQEKCAWQRRKRRAPASERSGNLQCRP